MDWLSLCVCGTKRSANDRKTKKDGKRKKGKKSKKNFKQKGSCNAPPFIVEEFLRKSQDEQPKEKEWANGEIVNCLDDRAKDQVGSTDQTDPSKVNGSPSYQIDGHEVFEKSLENSERNAGESAREPRDIDYYGNAVLHSRCASSTADENEEQVKDTSEREHDEEADLDVPRSMASGELEDSSWTSEIEDRQDAASSFDRKLGERISSRINFSNEKQGKSKASAAPRKGIRNILPPIKGRSRAETRMDNEDTKARGETNRFGFKRPAASHERNEIRRKLNSCSFEIQPFQDEERDGKATRTRGEGSMIPRLASPLRQGVNSIKNDKEIVQNGT